MAQSVVPVSEPIPISLIAGRYLLFDINVVTYLRRTHHICGTLIGTIPQNPAQNLFLGLPVELTPEEAKLLVQKEIAYIVDDTAWHRSFHTSDGVDKQKYLQSLRDVGTEARKAAQHRAKKSSQKALAKIALKKATAEANVQIEGNSSGQVHVIDLVVDETSSILADDSRDSSSLFGDERSNGIRAAAYATQGPYTLTPTTTYAPSSLAQNPTQLLEPTVRSSYALFAHLHSLDYFIMPGLRFGCDYNVYPGDPLRFHSHFLSTSYEWEQDIPMVDIIGGGRLGTGVKKGFLIGGADTDNDGGKADVRTFCIEWGGM